MQTEPLTNSLDQSNMAERHSAPFEHGHNVVATQDLNQLLDRCRGDLITVDTLLSELENVQHQQVGTSSNITAGRSDGSQPSKSAGVDATSLAITGHDLIRRLADDIEDLCRTSASSAAHELMLDLQARMVRCLRMLPAGSGIVRH